MNKIELNNSKATINEMLEMISGFETGNFSKTLSASEDPNLMPLIEKLNSAAKFLSQQASLNPKSSQETELIVKSLGIGIWKWDLVSNSLEWDENMYRIYGANPDDFSGAYDAWESSLSAETKAKAVEEINTAIAGGRPFDTTFQVVQRNSGKIQEVRTRAVVIRDNNGKALKMWGINIDRTREAELEVELKKEQEKAIRTSKLASLGEMSAGIAHEINNPLAIITGALELLTKFADNPEKLAAKIEAIKKSCDRISRIVGGLKKFSRTSDKAYLENHDLSKIIKEAIFITETKSKRHETLVTYDFKTQSHIVCDEVEIEQVLVNLINNSIDAVKTRPEKWIKISLDETEHSIVLKVTDSGPGISESARSKIFQPFFTTKNTGEGTGIGLSICKGILDEHKATIAVVVDSPNTCFEIKFPKSQEREHAN